MATLDFTAGTLTDAEHDAQLRRALIASTIGTTIEWYDFLLYGTVIQGPTSEAVSGGDGRVVYLGTWKPTGNSLHVEYRLVSRTVEKKGETLPGLVQSEDVRVNGSTLLFQKDRFSREEKLDSDAEFKIILERESVPQGASDKPH